MLSVLVVVLVFPGCRLRPCFHGVDAPVSSDASLKFLLSNFHKFHELSENFQDPFSKVSLKDGTSFIVHDIIVVDQGRGSIKIRGGTLGTPLSRS